MNEKINIPNNNNLEIDKALKEFEAKNTEQKQEELKALKTSAVSQKEAPDIKFETDNWEKSASSFQDNTPKMVKLVMKISGGAIKGQRQAEYVLLGFVVVAVVISLFLVFGGKGNTSSVDVRDPSLSLPPI